MRTGTRYLSIVIASCTLWLLFSGIHASLAASQGGIDNSPAQIPWWQIATGILGIPAAVIGIPSAFWLSQKTRLETRKLQLEILEKQGTISGPQTGIVKTGDIAGSREATLVGIQGFVVRFIILYVTRFGWDVFKPFLMVFLNASVAYWLKQNQTISQEWTTVMGITAYTQIVNVGDLIILIAFGFPLLADIHEFAGYHLPWNGRK